MSTIIIRNANQKDIAKAAATFGRIEVMAERPKVMISKRKPVIKDRITKAARYSKSDIAYIRKNFSTMNLNEMATKLGRTKGAIEVKAYSLGLHRR